MDVFLRDNWACVYLTRTKKDKANNRYPSVRLNLNDVSISSETLETLKELAKRTDKRLARKQREFEKSPAYYES